MKNINCLSQVKYNIKFLDNERREKLSIDQKFVRIDESTVIMSDSFCNRFIASMDTNNIVLGIMAYDLSMGEDYYIYILSYLSSFIPTEHPFFYPELDNNCSYKLGFPNELIRSKHLKMLNTIDQ